MKNLVYILLGFISLLSLVWFITIHKHNSKKVNIFNVQTYKDYYITTGMGEKIYYKYDGPLPIKFIGNRITENIIYNENNEPSKEASKSIIGIINQDTSYIDIQEYRDSRLPDFPFWIIDTNYELKIHYVESLIDRDTLRYYPDNSILFRNLNFQNPITVFERGYLLKSNRFTQK